MRIAFLVNYFPKISETFIMNQVIGLIEKGHEVSIFALEKPEESITHEQVTEYSLLSKTTYLEAPTGYTDGMLTLLRLGLSRPDLFNELLRSLSRGIEGGVRISTLSQFENQVDSDFDIYHAHFGPVGKRWDFIPNISTSPFITSFYGHDASQDVLENGPTYEHLFKVADCITVLSEDMRKDVVSGGCPEDKTKIIPLAVDMEEFKSKPSSPPTGNTPIRILTVARLTHKKGLDDALQAIDEVNEEYNLKWVIAGEGPLREELESEIEERELTDVVELLGWVTQDQIREEYEDSHIFVLPSKTAIDGNKEGTPTVLLEAQATSVPVLSTTHAGIPEVVQDGRSGILVPENDPDELTDALKRLLSSQSDWEEMGKQGRAFVENRHSITTVADELEQLYREVISIRSS